MKTKHMSALLRDDITTVSAHIYREVMERDMNGIKQYTFKVLRTDAALLKSGSLVVVDTKNGMTLAQVCDVHDAPQIEPDYEGDYRWVVDSVDMERFGKVLAHERELDKVMLTAEREVARRSVVELYRETLGKIAVGTRFQELLHGPSLEGPAVAPKRTTKRTAKR